VALGQQASSSTLESYANTAAGQQQLAQRLRGLRAEAVVVCLEASGNYSLLRPFKTNCGPVFQQTT